jgi:phospholipid/cholesterol/gamma-HCH transport system permease protein
MLYTSAMATETTPVAAPTKLNGSPGSAEPWSAVRTARGRLQVLGEMTVLGLRVLVALATPPFVWWREFLRQCVFVMRVSIVPLAIAVPTYAFGGPGIQGGGFLTELGAVDRVGGVVIIGTIRDFGVFVVASYVAGIYGTTIAAEFGARKIREEIDALQVLGVDILHYMIAPRVAALTVMLATFTSLIIVFGTFGGWVAGTILLDATPSAFFSTYFLNSSWLDVLQSYGKSIVIGFLVGVVCCYRGITTTGGAEGVGRSVNSAIVDSLIVIFFVNLVYTMIFVSAFPQIQVLR